MARMANRVRNTLYLSGFLDLFAVSMILPLILPQVRQMGASHTLAGVIGSVYGCLQLFSSPFYGRWSDTVSRQLSLVVCMTFTCIGYSILGLFSSLAAFCLARALLGCFKHSQTINKAFLTDICSKEEHAMVLGHFNSFSSMGFIVGPVIGGHMAETSLGFSLVACSAGIVFLANAGLLWVVFPRDKPADHKGKCVDEALKHEDSSIGLEKLRSEEINFSVRKFISALQEFDWSSLWDLFLIKFLAGFSMIVFRSNFTLVLKEQFEASPKVIGYMTSFSGIVATLTGFIIGPVMKRFYNNSSKLLLYMTLFQVISLFFITCSPSLFALLIFLTPLNISTSISRVCGTTLTIARTGGGKVGSIMGLSQSVMSVARMIAPFVAGVAQEVSVYGASTISVVAAFLSVLIMIMRPQDPEMRKGVKEKTS